MKTKIVSGKSGPFSVGVEEIYTLEEIKEKFGSLVNPNCKKCYGRGYEGMRDFIQNKDGKRTVTKMYVQCSCTTREDRKLPDHSNGMLNGRTRMHGEMLAKNGEYAGEKS